MDSYTQMKFVTIVITVWTCTSSGASVLATSNTKLQAFMSLDLAAGLDRYIAHEHKRLEVIKNAKGYEKEVPLVVERLQKLGSLNQILAARSADNKKLQQKRVIAPHPTTTLRHVRDFLDMWSDRLKNETLYGFRLREFLTNDKSELPTESDIDDIARALVEIQYVYNLSTSDLYAGKVKGVQGLTLTPPDAFDLGRVSMKLGHLQQAAIWFEWALAGLSQEERESGNASFPVAETLANLGVLKFNLDEKDKGIQLLEQAADLDHESETIAQKYLSHRFGRDVQRLTETDPGENKKHWFRLCDSATSATMLQTSQKWYHVCRYRRSPLVPYRVYREEILGRSPFVSLVHQLVTGPETDELVNTSIPKLKKHAMNGAEGLLHFAEGTTINSKAAIAERILDRISDLTGLVTREIEGFEDHWVQGLQVLNYGVAGTFLPHADDAYEPRRAMEMAGYRMASVLIYLNDVTAGGATAFTSLNVTVIPRKGSAVLWYNRRPSGDLEENTTHAECLVAVGTKWVALQGIWSNHNELRRPCGPKKTSSHLVVDKIVGNRYLRRRTLRRKHP